MPPQFRSKTMLVKINGRRASGIAAKDLMLAVIEKIGFAGGTGYAIEYGGEAVRALSIEERMTLCSMSIECGAKAGMVSPDEVTFDYLRSRPYAPPGIPISISPIRGLAALEHGRRRRVRQNGRA